MTQTRYKIGEETHIHIAQPTANFEKACDAARVKALRRFSSSLQFSEPLLMDLVEGVGDKEYTLELSFESYSLTQKKDRMQRHVFKFIARVVIP